MRINKEFLNKHEACKGGIAAFDEFFSNKSVDLKAVIELCFEKQIYTYEGKEYCMYECANWLITRVLKLKDKIRYAIYAADDVLPIFEKKFPEDSKPRRAIQSAKKCLKYNNKKNRVFAAAAAATYNGAAYYATYNGAAYYAAAYYAAAYYAAVAVYYAAVAADATAITAAAAAAAAAAASENKTEALKKYIQYGLTLIYKN